MTLFLRSAYYIAQINTYSLFIYLFISSERFSLHFHVTHFLNFFFCLNATPTHEFDMVFFSLGPTE